MKIIAVFIVAIMLAGCASDKEYLAYISAQQEANRQAAADQKPLVRITAQPGQQITGLQSLEIYTPTVAPTIQQARPNEWVGAVQTGLAVTGTILGIRAGGIAAASLARTVGENSRGNTTNTMTTTSTTDSSNNSVNTVSTDSHNTDSHNVDSHNTDRHDTTDRHDVPKVCAIDPATGALACR